MVSVSVPGLSAAELARRLRLDEACVFGRIEDDLRAAGYADADR